jgi:Flp pilus assembly protein CpaB
MQLMAQQPITLRMRQRRRQRLLMLAAALFLLIAGAAYYWYAGTRPDRPREEPQPAGTVSVPVATADLPMGEMIRPQSIRPRYVEPSQVPVDAVLRPQQLAGRVVVRGVPAGAYLRQEDLAPEGAPAGLSGLAKPGMRVVVVEAAQMAAVPGFIRTGDRVDVLAISYAAAPGAVGQLDRLRSSPNTVEGGGSQPGDPNAPARRLARTPRAGFEVPTVAKLVSEDAEVLQVPRPQADPRMRRVERHLVLQMKPEDAHNTTLALASGQTIRLVYRPFNDRTRVTTAEPVSEFTHTNVDSRRVEIINGVSRGYVTTTLD